MLRRESVFNISNTRSIAPYCPPSLPLHPLFTHHFSPFTSERYIFHLAKDRLSHPESLPFTTPKLIFRSRNIYLSEVKGERRVVRGSVYRCFSATCKTSPLCPCLRPGGRPFHRSRIVRLQTLKSLSGNRPFLTFPLPRAFSRSPLTSIFSPLTSILSPLSYIIYIIRYSHPPPPDFPSSCWQKSIFLKSSFIYRRPI